jgi:hypothetical protein
MNNDWQALCSNVVEKMTQAVWPTITPITRSTAENEGELIGTGTYLRLLTRPYLLTNEHVARFQSVSGLAHLPSQGGDYYRITTHFQAISSPLDVAVASIDESILEAGDRQCVPPEYIADNFRSSQYELFFVLGFPGERSRMSGFAGGLLTRGVPYLTQEAPLPASYEHSTSFALHYPFDKPLTTSDGKSSVLPDPHGLSGSPVWATGLPVITGNTSNPGQPKIVGVIRLWDLNDHVLVGTRIEFVREFLLHALRREFAYFSWLDRGMPLGDDWTDWFSAEAFIPQIW